jgi:hypothetical protein
MQHISIEHVKVIPFVPNIKEEHMLMVFENRLLRRIFRLEKGEVSGGWRKLHDEELNCTHHQV